ncbi:MAG: hypothetical protein Q7S56_01190 [Nanoarchaeota archaeon]|nr:hypothetical protein [Nanoarchaeota archaeon]
MKNKFLVMFFLALLIVPLIAADDITVKKLSSNEVMIADLNAPATFNISITNERLGQTFTINNELGFFTEPSDPIRIKQGETKNILLKVYPREGMQYRGFYSLPYVILAENGQKYNKELNFEIINLKDAFEIGAADFNPESQKIIIYITNKKNFYFPKMDVKFSSEFFTLDKSFSLNPHEKKVFEVELNKEDFDKLLAGFYTMNADVSVANGAAEVLGKIKFSEKNILNTTEKDSGFIIRTSQITKTNLGNTVENTTTTITKNMISRLFTTISPDVDSVQRDGTTVYYVWDRQLKPGESLNVKVSTNWTFPLLIIIFIIAIVILAKRIKKTDLELKKKINFVKAKGGEFALKVTLNARAKDYIENVHITDRLPPLVKMHERFGGEMPSHVDEKTRRIEWNFRRMGPGETRTMSYIVYSKFGVLGRFALPSAKARFEKNGKMEESDSNRAFFVADQKAVSEDF